MSNLSEAVAAFETAGGSLAVEGDDIKVTYPKGRREVLTPFLSQLRAHKDEVKHFVLERDRIHSAQTHTLYGQKETPQAEVPLPLEAGVSEGGGCGFALPECPPLPLGVRLIRYRPKSPPVAVQPCSIVTDVDKFIRAYLCDLKFRLEHPDAYACASLREILAKLAEVGLELALEVPAKPTGNGS